MAPAPAVCSPGSAATTATLSCCHFPALARPPYGAAVNWLVGFFLLSPSFFNHSLNLAAPVPWSYMYILGNFLLVVLYRISFYSYQNRFSFRNLIKASPTFSFLFIPLPNASSWNGWLERGFMPRLAKPQPAGDNAPSLAVSKVSLDDALSNFV